MATTSIPQLRILLLVTTGGFTHAAPVLEIGKELAARGHHVEFATLSGQEKWADAYPSLKGVRLFGPAVPEKELEAHYTRMYRWDTNLGFGEVMKSKYLFDSYWTDTYVHLKEIVQNPESRPDVIIADFFADAAKDMLVEFNVPVAMVWPQMPYLMVPCSYIPGQPGLQVDFTLTSEHASMWSRIRNELVVFWALPQIIRWAMWTKNMRRRAGVSYSPPTGPKPPYLVLVNSFFGLESPKDLPPLVASVGPILPEEYPSLTEPYSSFLDSHSRTIYVALGTHLILPEDSVIKITRGLIAALDEGTINGVIWAVGKDERRHFNRTQTYHRENGADVKMGDMLDGAHAQFLFSVFAPQRAILAHAHTRIYLSHGGGSSANEALFHGKPVLALGIFFDQLCNSARLVAAGTALSLAKFHFSSAEIRDKIHALVVDETGLFARDCERMRRIACVAARRKRLAADLVEEYVYDHQLRFVDDDDDDAGPREVRPMHLQTADMRMSAFKARNWDLMAVMVAGSAALVTSTWVGTE
ncbi:MAG: hypothetical protein M1819_004560 [Sarea resinae]|nr:MAG: hypothetical protein M1819_004560 [Sarea resinae]